MLKSEWEKLCGEFQIVTEKYCPHLLGIFSLLTRNNKDPIPNWVPKLAGRLAESYEKFIEAVQTNMKWSFDHVSRFIRMSEAFRTPGAFVRSSIKLIHKAYSVPHGFSDDTLGGFTWWKVSVAWCDTFYGLYVAWRPDSLIVIPVSRYRLLKLATVEPGFLRVISAREFEEFVAYVLELMGCKVELTQQTRDWGADILAWHGGPFKSEILTAIQVKRYAGHRKATLKNVYELNGAVAHYNTDLGQVVTTSTFTKPAMAFAKKQHINLVDMQKLHEELMRLVGK
jgi:hypothetical protein